MRVFLFEWLSSGGMWVDGIDPADNPQLLAQGVAMFQAMATDLAAADVDLIVMQDVRIQGNFRAVPNVLVEQARSVAETWRLLEHLSTASDHVIIIAPESDGCLVRCLECLGAASKKLVSPDVDFARLTSNKNDVFEFLQQHGFTAFPPGGPLSGRSYDSLSDNDFPLVIKPVDGVGSEGIKWIAGRSELEANVSANQNYRAEQFVSGTPVSVSVLCGKRRSEILTPTVQLFDAAPIGRYLDSRYPMDSDLSRRAIRLTENVLQALPSTCGYIGLDLVISDQGCDHDCLIEINPRLTMSYVRLREIYGINLAQRMLEIATQTHEPTPCNHIFVSPTP